MNIIGLGGTGDIKLIKISDDNQGNPRYVSHFLNISNNYKKALKLAKKIGGRMYYSKKYTGGILFQNSNPLKIKKEILKIKE